MDENFYDYAVRLSREAALRRELSRVSAETGLDYSWLYKFSRGLIPGASYERVTRLATYYQQKAPQ